MLQPESTELLDGVQGRPTGRSLRGSQRPIGGVSIDLRERLRFGKLRARLAKLGSLGLEGGERGVALCDRKGPLSCYRLCMKRPPVPRIVPRLRHARSSRDLGVGRILVRPAKRLFPSERRV